MAGWDLQSHPSVLEELCAPLHCRCMGAAELKGSQCLTREKFHMEGGFTVTNYLLAHLCRDVGCEDFTGDIPSLWAWQL